MIPMKIDSYGMMGYRINKVKKLGECPGQIESSNIEE
jgi:hypothetical protein